MQKGLLEIDGCEIVVLLDEGAYRFCCLHFEGLLADKLIQRAEIEYWPEVARLLDDGEEPAAETSCRGGLYGSFVEQGPDFLLDVLLVSVDTEDWWCRRLVVDGIE